MKTLYQWLTDNNIEKAGFARTLGVAESTLYKYINNQRVPRLDIAIKLHVLTGRQVEYLALLPNKDKKELVEFFKTFANKEKIEVEIAETALDCL